MSHILVADHDDNNISNDLENDGDDEMDPKDVYVVEALSTAAEDVGNGLESENDTNSLQSLSHLDPPVEGALFMVFGVMIAMIAVGLIIILVAVGISKLRKREDHSQHHHHHHHQNNSSNNCNNCTNSVHPEQVVHQQCTATNVDVDNPTSTKTTTTLNSAATVTTNGGGHVNQAMSSSTTTVDSCCNTTTSTAVTMTNNNNNNNQATDPQTMSVYTTNTSAEQFIWQFPPPYPPTNTPPPQYTLYNDQDTLVHGLSQTDRQGFAKGFRKNLGGRWRRLVKRKPESESCAIPPELKDQLKTIYVY